MTGQTIIAMSAYSIVALLGLAAAFAALKAKRPKADLLTWVFCAILFAAFIVMRWHGLEENWRDALRDYASSAGVYEGRREWQALLAAIAIVAGAALMVWGFLRWRAALRSRQRIAIFTARFLMAAFIPLYALRLISLHLTDVLLYRGPLRLNWLLEGALTLGIGAAAIMYLLALRPHLAHSASARR